MKKKIQVLMLIFITTKISGQVICNSPQALPPPQLLVQECPGLMVHYPYSSGPPLKTVVPLNFNFLSPPGAASGIYDTVTIACANYIVKQLNNMWSADSIHQPTLPLPSPYTAPYYNQVKIEFSVKTFTIIENSAYWDFHEVNKDSLMTDTNAINIFWACTPSYSFSGVSFSVPSRAVQINGHHPSGSQDMLNDKANRTLLHELGHAMGLWHTNEYIDPLGNYVKLTTSNSSGTIRSQIIDDYWVEDSTQWANPIAGGNNLMSYNDWDSRYLSPKQMAYMHYMLKTHPLLKNIPTAWAPGNTACLADHNNDITISSNVTLSGSALYPPGDLIIQSGTHVTLNNCLTLRENAKVIVEPGAKFSILGGGINTMESCQGQWWGIEVQSSPNAVQSLNSSDPTLPGTGVGMLELDHATLSNARCAVYVSEDAGLAIGNNVPGTGAGIVYSNNSTFLNNQYGMYFDTYYTLGGATNNLSYSRRDSFVVNSDFKTTVGNAIPINCIKIDKAPGIEIIGDYFKDQDFISSVAIDVQDCDVNIMDYCSSSGCTGTRMRNRFYGFQAAINVANSFNIVPAKIDHVLIEQGGYYDNKTEGAIYILNSLAPIVLNSNIKTVTRAPNFPNAYDLYLDNCDAYSIENNEFTGGIPVKTIGAVISNSGANPNSIYNNTFYDLTQGLWTQFQNYDPVTGAGLVMNCNDFLATTKFNIGIQGYAGSTSGVAEVQGTADPIDETRYVRNKYYPRYSSCPNNSEAKFYINTPNAFVITSHGTFNSSAFWPTPQINNSCSNSSELMNQVGISPADSTDKTSYCPVNFLPSYAKPDLQLKVSTLRETRNDLSVAYYQSLDGGNTIKLLNLISNCPSVIGYSQLRDTLLSKDFLSDTVLKAFFLLSGVPDGDLNGIFLNNYPLYPKVWTVASELSVSRGIMEEWVSRQQENILSPRETQRSRLIMAINDVGIYGNEKVRRFLTDSTGPLYDSIVAHYSLNETPMSKWILARTYIAAGAIDQAEIVLDDLESADTTNADGCRMLRYTARLAADQTYADTMRADSSIYEYLLDRATYSLKPIKEGYSRALLKIVYDHYVTPERLHPEEEEEGGRMANQQTQVQKVLEEKDEILIFPNPASQSLNVQVQKNKGPFLVKITGLDGKLLIEKTCAQDCELDLQPLINGVYLLHLYKQDQLLNTKKVIVIK